VVRLTLATVVTWTLVNGVALATVTVVRRTLATMVTWTLENGVGLTLATVVTRRRVEQHALTVPHWRRPRCQLALAD
jgi:hypothetical protein